MPQLESHTISEITKSLSNQRRAAFKKEAKSKIKEAAIFVKIIASKPRNLLNAAVHVF